MIGHLLHLLMSRIDRIYQRRKKVPGVTRWYRPTLPPQTPKKEHIARVRAYAKLLNTDTFEQHDQSVGNEAA